MANSFSANLNCCNDTLDELWENFNTTEAKEVAPGSKRKTFQIDSSLSDTSTSTSSFTKDNGEEDLKESIDVGSYDVGLLDDTELEDKRKKELEKTLVPMINDTLIGRRNLITLPIVSNLKESGGYSDNSNKKPEVSGDYRSVASSCDMSETLQLQSGCVDVPLNRDNILEEHLTLGIDPILQSTPISDPSKEPEKLG